MAPSEIWSNVSLFHATAYYRYRYMYMQIDIPLLAAKVHNQSDSVHVLQGH